MADNPELRIVVEGEHGGAQQPQREPVGAGAETQRQAGEDLRLQNFRSIIESKLDLTRKLSELQSSQRTYRGQMRRGEREADPEFEYDSKLAASRIKRQLQGVEETIRGVESLAKSNIPDASRFRQLLEEAGRNRPRGDVPQPTPGRVNAPDEGTPKAPEWFKRARQERTRAFRERKDVTRDIDVSDRRRKRIVGQFRRHRRGRERKDNVRAETARRKAKMESAKQDRLRKQQFDNRLRVGANIAQAAGTMLGGRAGRLVQMGSLAMRGAAARTLLGGASGSVIGLGIAAGAAAVAIGGLHLAAEKGSELLADAINRYGRYGPETAGTLGRQRGQAIVNDIRRARGLDREMAAYARADFDAGQAWQDASATWAKLLSPLALIEKKLEKWSADVVNGIGTMLDPEFQMNAITQAADAIAQTMKGILPDEVIQQIHRAAKAVEDDLKKRAFAEANLYDKEWDDFRNMASPANAPRAIRGPVGRPGGGRRPRPLVRRRPIHPPGIGVNPQPPGAGVP